MGQVWQAIDTQLNRDVALKILPDAFAADPDRLARFKREVQILASGSLLWLIRQITLADGTVLSACTILLSSESGAWIWSNRKRAPMKGACPAIDAGDIPVKRSNRVAMITAATLSAALPLARRPDWASSRESPGNSPCSTARATS